MVAGRLQEKVWRTVYIWMPLNFLDINIHVGFAFAPFQNFSTQFPDNSIPSNPSINKSQKFLAIHTFLWYEKKNHIRLKIMASRYIFLFLRNYLCTTTLPINRKKKRPDINQQKKKWQLEQLSTPQHRKIGLGRKRAQQQFFLPQLLSSILCCPFPFFTVMYG